MVLRFTAPYVDARGPQSNRCDSDGALPTYVAQLTTADIRRATLRSANPEIVVDDALLLWEHEQRLWVDTANFCRQHLSANALLTLWGCAFDRALGAEALHEASRWTDVTFSAQRALHVSADMAVIGYVAEMKMEDTQTPCVAHCSSTYVRVCGTWLLVAHQRDDVQLWSDRRAQLDALSLFLTTADEIPRRVRQAGS